MAGTLKDPPPPQALIFFLTPFPLPISKFGTESCPPQQQGEGADIV